jgi:hypothetical protein
MKLYIHEHQVDYPPFPSSKEFLDYLYIDNHVIIASHRLPKYQIPLINWLDKYNKKSLGIIFFII